MAGIDWNHKASPWWRLLAEYYGVLLVSLLVVAIFRNLLLVFPLFVVNIIAIGCILHGGRKGHKTESSPRETALSLLVLLLGALVWWVFLPEPNGSVTVIFICFAARFAAALICNEKLTDGFYYFYFYLILLMPFWLFNAMFLCGYLKQLMRIRWYIQLPSSQLLW